MRSCVQFSPLSAALLALPLLCSCTSHRAADAADAPSAAPLAPVPAAATWSDANLTWYESYPDPGSDECVLYNGCKWAGYFAALDGQQTPGWVANHNIAAVHEKDFPKYREKTLRLRQGDNEIDVVVYDMCADSDCDGCCSANSSQTGFLIDIESHTRERFGSGSGVVEWTCLDCE